MPLYHFVCSISPLPNGASHPFPRVNNLHPAATVDLPRAHRLPYPEGGAELPSTDLSYLEIQLVPDAFRFDPSRPAIVLRPDELAALEPQHLPSCLLLGRRARFPDLCTTPCGPPASGDRWNGIARSFFSFPQTNNALLCSSSPALVAVALSRQVSPVP